MTCPLCGMDASNPMHMVTDCAIKAAFRLVALEERVKALEEARQKAMASLGHVVGDPWKAEP